MSSLDYTTLESNKRFKLNFDGGDLSSDAGLLLRAKRALIAHGYSKEAVIDEEAKFMEAVRNNRVDRVLTHVAPDGPITTYRLDKDGKKMLNEAGDYLKWS